MALIFKKKPAPKPVVAAPPARAVSFVLDNQLNTVLAANQSKAGLVTYGLMASLAYYHLDISILSDSRYDQLCRQLYDEWDTVEHYHKPLIQREDLKAGSLYALALHEYPNSNRFGLIAITDNTPLELNTAQRQKLMGAHFCPPEHSWDTYLYGAEERTWRQHQVESRKHFSQCVKNGTMTKDEFHTRMRDMGTPDATLIDRKKFRI